MQRAQHYIAWTTLAAAIISLLYFFCLAAGLSSIYATTFIILTGLTLTGVLAHKWRPENENVRHHLLSYGILTLGLIALLVKTHALAEKYGGWDAWTMWNFHAKFLSNPTYWKMMFDNAGFGHPDYPLLLPSHNAFLSRIFGVKIETVAYLFSLWITTIIPVMLFIQVSRKSIVAAAAALLILVFDEHYVKEGISMYADTTVTCFLLIAFVVLKNKYPDRIKVFTVAVALGCCAWTKNEGLLLACLFTTMHLRLLFGAGRYMHFAAGVALPLLALATFKLLYAPSNDMVSGLSSTTLMQLGDPERYKLILGSISENATQHFGYLKIAFPMYVIACVWLRKWPDKTMWFVCCSMGAFVVVYLLSYVGLEWHLFTSMHRLMHQIVPLALFSIASRLSEIQIDHFRGIIHKKK